MFSLRKVYLIVAISLDRTSLLAAEHNNERISVLGCEGFSNEGSISKVSPASTELKIARFDKYVIRLNHAIGTLEKRMGTALKGFALVLPSGNFSVVKDLRERIFTLPKGIVTSADIEKALDIANDHKNLTTCLTIPYSFSLDEVSSQTAPLNRTGSSLMVLRAHYCMDVEKSAPFFALANECKRELMRMVPDGLALLNECCDHESLRTGVVGFAIHETQLTVNKVRLGFENELFAPLAFGKQAVLEDVAAALGVDLSVATAYAQNIDLFSNSSAAVVRTFFNHYSQVSDITVQQVATALRNALSRMLGSLKSALGHKRFGASFPTNVCFSGFFVQLPGFKRIVQDVFGQSCRVIIGEPTVVGAKSAELFASLGAVRILAMQNSLVENKEYAMDPYESPDLNRGNIRKQRALYASRMVAKALEGVLGNK